VKVMPTLSDRMSIRELPNCLHELGSSHGPTFPAMRRVVHNDQLHIRSKSNQLVKIWQVGIQTSDDCQRWNLHSSNLRWRDDKILESAKHSSLREAVNVRIGHAVGNLFLDFSFSRFGLACGSESRVLRSTNA